MSEHVEASSQLEKLPDRQHKTVMNLIENRGHDENSRLSAYPVAITPNGEYVLHVGLRPFSESPSYVAVSPTDSVSQRDYLADKDHEFPPVMNKQDMMILAR